MKLRTLALAATFALTAAPALAAAGSVSATLQAPVSSKTKVVAGGAVFNCVDTTCVAKAPSSRTFSAATCKQLVKEVGAVTAFGHGERQLKADVLARCNGETAVAASGAN